MQRYDVAVCSGSLFSCLVAAGAARQGLRVCLFTPRYSLGDEFSASLAPFFRETGEETRPAWMSTLETAVLEGHHVFSPGNAKKTLLTYLNEAGVEIRFGRQVVLIQETSLLISDKDGLHPVSAKAVIRESRTEKGDSYLSMECCGASTESEGINIVQGRDSIQYALFACNGMSHIQAAYLAALQLRSRNDSFFPARICDEALPASPGGAKLTDKGVFADSLLPAFATMHTVLQMEEKAREAIDHIIALCRNNSYGRALTWNWEDIPAVSPTQVLVCGGGTGGIPAAYAAAVRHASVTLCERFPQLGGIGTLGGINVYFAANDACIRGFSCEIDARTASIEKEISAYEPNPHRWNILARQIALQKLLSEADVRTMTGCSVVAARRSGNKIQEVLLASGQGLRRVQADVFVDFTGDGDLATSAGIPYSLGDVSLAGLQASNQCAWKYSSRFEGINVDLSVVDPTRADDLDRSARLAHADNNGYDFSEFCSSRESRHLQGAYRLREEDVFLSIPFKDAIIRNDGRFDQHSIQSSSLSRMGFLPYHHRIHTAYLPLRCCYSPEVVNLLFGGKTISASRDAFSFFRMQQDIINEGYALGIVAATAPDGIVGEVDLAYVQHELRDKGILDEASEHMDVLRECSDRLLEGDPYGALLGICIGEDAVYVLQKRVTDDGMGGVWAQIALTWLGRADYTDALLDYIRRYYTYAPKHLLDEENRPEGGWHKGECDEYWTVNAAITALAKHRCKAFLPLLGQLIASAKSGGEANKHIRLHWRRIPFYDRIVCLCQAAEEYADDSLAPAFEELLGRTWLQEEDDKPHSDSNEFDHFPIVQLETIVAVAAARCKSRTGKMRLDALSKDRRSIIRLAAQSELNRRS